MTVNETSGLDGQRQVIGWRRKQRIELEVHHPVDAACFMVRRRQSLSLVRRDPCMSRRFRRRARLPATCSRPDTASLCLHVAIFTGEPHDSALTRSPTLRFPCAITAQAQRSTAFGAIGLACARLGPDRPVSRAAGNGRMRQAARASRQDPRDASRHRHPTTQTPVFFFCFAKEPLPGTRQLRPWCRCRPPTYLRPCAMADRVVATPVRFSGGPAWVHRSPGRVFVHRLPPNERDHQSKKKKKNARPPRRAGVLRARRPPGRGSVAGPCTAPLHRAHARCLLARQRSAHRSSLRAHHIWADPVEPSLHLIPCPEVALPKRIGVLPGTGEHTSWSSLRPRSIGTVDKQSFRVFC